MNNQGVVWSTRGIPPATASPALSIARSVGGGCTGSSKWIAPQMPALGDSLLRGFSERWTFLALMLASVFLVASCVGTSETLESSNLTQSSTDVSDTSTGVSDTLTVEPGEQSELGLPPTVSPFPDAGEPNPPAPQTSEDETPVSTADVEPASSTSSGEQHVSLRPKSNDGASDLLDHWGHRHRDLITSRLSEATAPGSDVADVEDPFEFGRKTVAASYEFDLQDEEDIDVLGQRRGVIYGRWTDGPADALSIEFDLQYATVDLQNNRQFRAALERAGKVWSHRISDTWQDWERSWGESRGRLIGNYGADGREIRVGAGGETSNELVIYVTAVNLSGDMAGLAGPRSLRSDVDWEPHTGAIAFDKDYVEEADEASLFRTMVHEIGHVLGAWEGREFMQRYAPYTDSAEGTWNGPNVVEVYGDPAPFQDKEDAHGWHDGERSPEAENFDLGHSGVCASVMAYCGTSAAQPAFLPAPIDFAFLADLGLTIRPDSDRPETYGLSGWLDHSAFSISVSRELDVSLADPQARYFINTGSWGDQDTVDLLWADAHVIGSQSTGNLANSFPLFETVRYAGGLIGTAVDVPGLPPVYGDANLSIDLNNQSEDNLTGKASFTSLKTVYNGERDDFGDGSLHYPIVVADNGISHEVTGVLLAADFYGSRHQEIAGTLDDSRAGLLASFGAKHDENPTHFDVIKEADYFRGMTYQRDYGSEGGRWYVYRCGSESTCERTRNNENSWYSVSAADDHLSQDNVGIWTASWGDWLSEDLHADHEAIRIVRRYDSGTDGGTGRFQQDGYFGTMEHAAFGTGFYSFVDWDWPDGERSHFYDVGAGFYGDLSGTRPRESVTWNGGMLGYEWGLDTGEDPFLEGHARVRASLYSNLVDIDFWNVYSIDRERSLANFGFDGISLASDGTFEDFDDGPVRGAFFGPAHEEVAGTFHKNDNNVTGSFGAVKLDSGSS